MDDDRKKYIEQWWRKYEVANELDKEFPLPHEQIYDLMNSVHQFRLNAGYADNDLEEDMAHHIAMQKVFMKWRDIYDTSI